MCQPGNGVALPTASRVLDEIIVPWSFRRGRSHKLSNCLEMVIAREYTSFFFDFFALTCEPLVNLQVEKPCQQIKQAIALQDLFPQIGRTIRPALRVRRGAGTRTGGAYALRRAPTLPLFP